MSGRIVSGTDAYWDHLERRSGSGTPVRSTATRRSNAPRPAAGRLASAAAVRALDRKLERMAAAKVAHWRHHEELRERASTLLWLSDRRMLVRARQRLAGIRNHNRAVAFELTGGTDG